MRLCAEGRKNDRTTGPRAEGGERSGQADGEAVGGRKGGRDGRQKRTRGKVGGGKERKEGKEKMGPSSEWDAISLKKDRNFYPPNE